LAGKGNLEAEIKKSVNDLNLSDRIIFYQYPSDDQLEELLVKSSGFIYPSFSEGFGIPLVEAATIGIPMALSKIPVFQELMNGVETVGWFDPYSVNEISQSILQLTETKSAQYSRLLEKVDVSNITKQYYDIYQSLLK
jgi:glycosyltransferase involved in cell wall biosynthesis